MSDKVTPLKTPASEGGEFELVPAGVYLARCYKMVDIGTQKVPYTPPGGKTVIKDTRQIILYWELLADQKGNNVFMEDGERVFSISNTYTWSMNKKANLRAVLDNWRGEPFTEEEANGFEITKVLGTYCQLQVVHKKSKDGSKTYANIGAVMAAEQTDYRVNEDSSFSIDNPDMEMFESFPEWLKNKIAEAKEWEGQGDTPVRAGKITEAGDIEIDDVDDSDTPPITKEELSKLPF